MIQWISNFSPIMQALIATSFTWAVTALGASLVFFFKTIRKDVLNGMLGFAAGVMIAASFWSLLKPAIEMSEKSGSLPWAPALIGFLSGPLVYGIVGFIVGPLILGITYAILDSFRKELQESK